jgi:hypothetical protein
MNKDIPFSVKLGAFMLNQVNTINVGEKGTFDSRIKEITGLLPFVQMNVSRQQFSKMMNSTGEVMQKSLNKSCKNNTCKDSANTLIQKFIDTIETSYKSKSNGRKMTRKVATCMKWQAMKGIIPESNVTWCKNLRNDGEMKKKLGWK